jgi:hypothetical protein
MVNGFSADDLDLLTRLELNERLGNIVAPSTLPEIAIDLIDWADKHGRLEDLVRAIRQARPENKELQDIAASLLAPAPAKDRPLADSASSRPVTVPIAGTAPSRPVTRTTSSRPEERQGEVMRIGVMLSIAALLVTCVILIIVKNGSGPQQSSGTLPSVKERSSLPPRPASDDTKAGETPPFPLNTKKVAEPPPSEPPIFPVDTKKRAEPP